MAAVPPWLSVMRTLLGEKEIAGASDNPVIVGMSDEIARHYPEMKSYCDLSAWDNDETPWCGLSAAYCMAEAGIRPPFGKTDTDKWGWAKAWGDDPLFGTVLSSPRLGCVVVLGRQGGGHVTFYERTEGSYYVCTGGNQSNAVTSAKFPKSDLIALVWPKESLSEVEGPAEPAERRTLEKGDIGDDVVALQKVLGIPADGDFGELTETQVEAYQDACQIDTDGVVGPQTWEHVDALAKRMAAMNEGLSFSLMEAITVLALDSPVMDYKWPDRGQAPPGYIPGMCLAFAVALKWLGESNSAAELMARNIGGPDNDALKWYEDELEDFGMEVQPSNVDTLRYLWTLLIGLGMRESSGRYCEGKDASAENTTADTCEAGLFQTSWNIRSASTELPKLFTTFWANPNGFLLTFSNGVNPSSANLKVYGSGEGATYQFLAKYSPMFACMSTAVGLRVLRKHWGPINRREVDLVTEVEDLLLDVQELVEQGVVEPPPEPPKPEVKPTVSITTIGEVLVTVNGKPV